MAPLNYIPSDTVVTMAKASNCAAHSRDCPASISRISSKPKSGRRSVIRNLCYIIPAEELSRLDIKNRTPTPKSVEDKLIASLQTLAPQIDVLIVMDQAGVPEMGAITPNVLSAIEKIHRSQPALIIIADSRHGLTDFPPFIYKMNATEFTTLTHSECNSISDIQTGAARLAESNQHPVFITMAEQGMIGATPAGESAHVLARPLRGPIDIVGAGDTVTATLALALATDATPIESMELAQAAASLVVHQLGTTGTPEPRDLRQLLST